MYLFFHTTTSLSVSGKDISHLNFILLDKNFEKLHSYSEYVRPVEKGVPLSWAMGAFLSAIQNSKYMISYDTDSLPVIGSKMKSLGFKSNIKPVKICIPLLESVVQFYGKGNRPSLIDLHSKIFGESVKFALNQIQSDYDLNLGYDPYAPHMISECFRELVKTGVIRLQ